MKVQFGGCSLATQRLKCAPIAGGTRILRVTHGRDARATYQLEIHQFLSRVQRSNAHLGFTAFDSIDDADRAERTQPHSISDLKRSRITGSAGASPAIFP